MIHIVQTKTIVLLNAQELSKIRTLRNGASHFRLSEVIVPSKQLWRFKSILVVIDSVIYNIVTLPWHQGAVERNHKDVGRTSQFSNL